MRRFGSAALVVPSLALCLLTALSLPGYARAKAKEGKIDTRLAALAASAAPDEELPVIVLGNGAALGKHGGKKKGELTLLGAVSGKLRAKDLDALAAGAAGVVFAQFSDLDDSAPVRVVAALLAGLAYTAVNHGVLCLAMAASEARRPLTVWRERFHWARFHFLGALGLLGRDRRRAARGRRRGRLRRAAAPACALDAGGACPLPSAGGLDSSGPCGALWTNRHTSGTGLRGFRASRIRSPSRAASTVEAAWTRTRSSRT
jgi:hypothetical protein